MLFSSTLLDATTFVGCTIYFVEAAKDVKFLGDVQVMANFTNFGGS